MCRYGKGQTVLPILVLLAVALSLSGCDRKEDPAVLRLLPFEQESYRGQPTSERNIERLRKEVDHYRKIVESKVEAAEKLGSYWKLLGIAYLEKDMYAMAYDSFLNALAVYPENPVLHYHAGLSAARLGTASPDPEKGSVLLGEAERLYRLAIRYDADYPDAQYALAVLYAFELDRPREARQLLVPLVERQPKRTEALFLLARTEAALGNTPAALDLYDRIIRDASVTGYREQAMRNRERLLGDGQ